MGVNGLRFEHARIFPFVETPDPAHPDIVIIKEEFFGVIDGMSQFDLLPDIGGRRLIEASLETDGGVVIDHPLMPDQKDLVQFGFGQPADVDPVQGGVVAVDRPLVDAGVNLVVVIVMQPDPECLVEFVDADVVPDVAQKTIPHGSKEPFDFPPGGAVVRFGVNQRDAGQGGAFGQHLRGEAGAVVHIEPLGDAVGEEGLLEDHGERAHGFGGAEGVPHDHAGMIVDHGAEDGLLGAVLNLHPGAVEEVAYPEFVDVVQFVGLARVGSVFQGEPAPGFDDPQQGVVVNRRIPQKALFPEVFIELLGGQSGIGPAFDLDCPNHLLVQAPGSSPVRSFAGFEGVKSAASVLPQPGLQRGDADFFQTIAGKVVLPFRLFPEVLVLGSRRFGKDR